jgi:acetoin utilization deacetylase AcuC-like enzyme
MGFCYLNGVAIAALHAVEALGARRVAVWDFDAHHGNGTEAILLGRPEFLYVSVHQSPCYPGTGLVSEGNARNYPVAPGTPAPEHLRALEASWADLLAFQPDLVLISAGFDAYAGDPITDLRLMPPDFAQLGVWVRESSLPAAAILEGGYSRDLPLLVEAFLDSWAAPGQKAL